MMRTEEWPQCIITALDLVGTRSLASSGRGSSKMIQMHERAVAKINYGLPLHSHGYVWNDSVLLLSYETKPPSRRREVLVELSEFKTWLELECEATLYAISVMGLAFPQNRFSAAVFNGQIAGESRAVVLKTSSWAMSNCFIIEKELGHRRADWYMDSRITNDVMLPKPFASQDVELLPRKKARTIHMYLRPMRPMKPMGSGLVFCPPPGAAFSHGPAVAYRIL